MTWDQTNWCPLCQQAEVDKAAMRERWDKVCAYLRLPGYDNDGGPASAEDVIAGYALIRQQLEAMDKDNARLREAIKAFHACWLRYPNYTEEYEEAVQGLFKIAREGR